MHGLAGEQRDGFAVRPDRAVLSRPGVSDFGAREHARKPASTRRLIQARAVRTASETSNTRPFASQPSRKPTLIRKSRRGPSEPATIV